MGRLAITAKLFFPNIKVASIEIVKERLDLAKEALQILVALKPSISTIKTLMN